MREREKEREILWHCNRYTWH